MLGKRGNSLPVSFYLLVATVANQTRRGDPHLIFKVPLFHSWIFKFAFCLYFSGLQIAKCQSVQWGLNCGRWTICPISVDRRAVGIRQTQASSLSYNVRNTPRPPPGLPSVRQSVSVSGNEGAKCFQATGRQPITRSAPSPPSQSNVIIINSNRIQQQEEEEEEGFPPNGLSVFLYNNTRQQEEGRKFFLFTFP